MDEDKSGPFTSSSGEWQRGLLWFWAEGSDSELSIHQDIYNNVLIALYLRIPIVTLTDKRKKTPSVLVARLDLVFDQYVTYMH